MAALDAKNLPAEEQILLLRIAPSNYSEKTKLILTTKPISVACPSLVLLLYWHTLQKYKLLHARMINRRCSMN